MEPKTRLPYRNLHCQSLNYSIVKKMITICKKWLQLINLNDQTPFSRTPKTFISIMIVFCLKRLFDICVLASVGSMVTTIINSTVRVCYSFPIVWYRWPYHKNSRVHVFISITASSDKNWLYKLSKFEIITTNFWNLLNHVIDVLACLRFWHTCVFMSLACLHVYVLAFLLPYAFI